MTATVFRGFAAARTLDFDDSAALGALAFVFGDFATFTGFTDFFTDFTGFVDDLDVLITTSQKGSNQESPTIYQIVPDDARNIIPNPTQPHRISSVARFATIPRCRRQSPHQQSRPYPKNPRSAPSE